MTRYIINAGFVIPVEIPFNEPYTKNKTGQKDRYQNKKILKERETPSQKSFPMWQYIGTESFYIKIDY